MGKSSNFSGQPIFNQLIKFIDKGEVREIARRHNAERYVKKFTTYNHLIVMLFVAFEGYHSIRETLVGLLANAHRLAHLGLNYVVRRSTLSEANKRRVSDVFADIYMSVYQRHGDSLTDSRLKDADMKRLYIMDSTTISLFKDILKGVGRNPKTGKKKGGIKAHTIIRASDHVPYLVRYSAAVRHDHTFLDEVFNLPGGSIITFDKGYVDYGKYEVLTESGIWYVTRLKDNAVYQARKEFNIPDQADSGVLKDEEIILRYGKNKQQEHRSRRIAYWDSKSERLFEFITNNFEMAAEKIALIYKRRWQIELLFKQLKQNFPLKYFLGDNENAIEIQIWSAMLANLLLTLIKSQVKRKWAFSNLVSLVRQQLMNYISLYRFLEDPEGSWRAIIQEDILKNQNTLFPEMRGACS
ncbi:IS4 family transposase [Echinicola vietnamensis]|uniref:Transposase family protein n=1 Tax=Echinicola vietnamensis (strain DSM 17526 / LMG 23754 / KMM 6221) TaxID=926556 RepID=L0G6Z6_ECHVK|nr:IS4 family transposase [Echinicola vietnamensis]AGA76943.1 transposase family protein [Echinicola vietnamensis DSM 17526]AGA77648.1 transposase family protein [Echinicola vietnamensis DSM 17526]AGA80048.1 transposase family protein [Echinicola vietnamensis DSM 17526]AGA80620.1 transposase family protein [Echinicola vietnamensis DSM 17526]